jgi:AraC-like DNA-binding protein
MTEKPVARGGRPRKTIDPELVKKLAVLHCTHAEIASVVGCSEKTLQRRFAHLIHAAREVGKTSLRRAMWTRALAGSERLLVWLSIQHLGMRHRDSTEVSSEFAETPARLEPVKHVIRVVYEPFVPPDWHARDGDSDDDERTAGIQRLRLPPGADPSDTPPVPFKHRGPQEGE